MATAAPLKSDLRFCTSCEGEGISSEVYSYCFNCDSLFCENCNKSHSKFTKDHNVAYGDDIPEHDTGEKHVFVPCALHSKENIDLYCKDHEVAMCNVCKLTSHRKCDVKNLSSAFAEVDVSKFRDEVSKYVMNLLGTAGKIDTGNQSWMEEVNEETNAMRNKIEYLRTEMNSVFDRYLQQLIAQYTSKIDFATCNSKVCKSINEHLTHRKDEMESKKGKHLKELLEIIKTNKLCNEYVVALEEITKETVPSQYVITEDDMAPSLIKQISDIAHRDIADSEEAVEEKIIPAQKKSFLKMKVCCSVQEEDVKMINDSNIPYIRGCCFIPNGCLAICDYANRKVKFLNRDMKIFYSIPCSEAPWGVDCFNENCVVVTIPAASSIQYIRMKPGIRLNFEIDVGYKVYGVTINGNITFVVVADYEKQKYGVQLLTGYGQKSSFIEHIGFGAPKCICTNMDGSKLYYSGGSYSSHYVNCLTQTGFGLYTIRTSALKDITTLISDDDENLIVCDVSTKCIHMIDSNGAVCGTVLSEKDVLQPQSMCLNKGNDLLIVASNNKGVVKLTAYKLEYDL